MDKNIGILRCKFSFICTMKWHELLATDDPNIRYCSTCDKGVHFCHDNADFKEAVANKWCIAMKQKHKIKQKYRVLTLTGAPLNPKSHNHKPIKVIQKKPKRPI